MALDGLLISSIVSKIQPTLPLRINKIAQISKYDIVFECFHHQKYSLLISMDPNQNKFYLTHNPYEKLPTPSHFIMLLRKYCENGSIDSITQHQLDRVIEIKVTNRNDLGDLVHYRLMVELMGKYSNLIVIDAHDQILDAFVRIAPYENSNRIIFTGASYSLPIITQPYHPFKDSFNESFLPLYTYFQGFSPLLNREFLFRQQPFNDFVKEICQSDNLYIYENGQFHSIELTHLHQNYTVYPLEKGFDALSLLTNQQTRLNEHTGDLSKVVKRELNRLKKKIPKLMDQKQTALSYDTYKNLGDCLLTFGQNISKGSNQAIINDFEGNSIQIDLDPKLTVIQNANKYFTKYQKLKKAIHYLDHEIELANQQIIYFEGLLNQIEQANLKDALQIRQELVEARLIHERKKERKQDKKIEVHSINYQGVSYLFGKSNIQNETLTFKIANKKDTWFHIQDGAGSHVVVRKPFNELTESMIRFAANLAAYYSSYRQSSSVAVNYTTVDQLKKIPKAPLGKVSLQQYQTIYIDPIAPDLIIDSKENS